jgi:hypothetical protein
MDRPVQDIRHDLAPDGGARPAPDEADVIHAMPEETLHRL